jgi:hypothetical protein
VAIITIKKNLYATKSSFSSQDYHFILFGMIAVWFHLSGQNHGKNGENHSLLKPGKGAAKSRKLNKVLQRQKKTKYSKK